MKALLGRRSLELAAILSALSATMVACSADVEDAAANDEAITAGAFSVAELVGDYDGVQGLMSNVSIREWGGAAKLTASFAYSGQRFTDVEFLLVPIEAGSATYVANSTLLAKWGSVQCGYPIDLEIKIQRDANADPQLFVKDNRPTGFASSAGHCPTIQNGWITDPAAYSKRSPATGLAQKLADLCATAKTRTSAVDSAKRLTTAALPASLPANIFSASGDWESLSTPGRDATLRGAVKAVYAFVAQSTQGPDAQRVATRMKRALATSDQQCGLGYTSSAGQPVALPLSEFVHRAYAISFDPYHCPELRWGAALGTPEFASCTQDAAHLQRYADEQTLRNYTVRPPNGATPIGSGPAQEDIDFVALIDRLSH